MRRTVRTAPALLTLAACLAVLALAPTATAAGPKAQTFRTGVTGTGEPNIGVAPDGTVYATAMHKTVRSTDGGRHFTDVTPPGHVTTLDPFLYVDKVTGRVYKSDLAGTCQLLSLERRPRRDLDERRGCLQPLRPPEHHDRTAGQQPDGGLRAGGLQLLPDRRLQRLLRGVGLRQVARRRD